VNSCFYHIYRKDFLLILQALKGWFISRSVVVERWIFITARPEIRRWLSSKFGMNLLNEKQWHYCQYYGKFFPFCHLTYFLGYFLTFWDTLIAISFDRSTHDLSLLVLKGDLIFCRETFIPTSIISFYALNSSSSFSFFNFTIF